MASFPTPRARPAGPAPHSIEATRVARGDGVGRGPDWDEFPGDLAAYQQALAGRLKRLFRANACPLVPVEHRRIDGTPDGTVVPSGAQIAALVRLRYRWNRHRVRADALAPALPPKDPKIRKHQEFLRWCLRTGRAYRDHPRTGLPGGTT